MTTEVVQVFGPSLWKIVCLTMEVHVEVRNALAGNMLLSQFFGAVQLDWEVRNELFKKMNVQTLDEILIYEDNKLSKYLSESWQVEEDKWGMCSLKQESCKR